MTGPGGSTGPSAKARARVLVIEGDDGSRRMLERLLDRLGCVPVFAQSGAAAREICEARPRFALWIVDPALPDEDGLALLTDLRAAVGDRAAPIAIYTATPPTRRPDGVIAVVEKPSGLGQLVGVVKSALTAGSRRAEATGPRIAARKITETYVRGSRPTAAPPPMAPAGADAARTSGTRRVPSRAALSAAKPPAGGRRSGER